MSTRTNHLANRLIIYYGPTGAGKSYTANMEYPGSKSILCFPNMTQADLLNSGLQEAMEAGNALILEAVNHLNESCINLLLAVCDGRTEYKEQDSCIKIHDDFKVVAIANFWDGYDKLCGYDKRVALLLNLVAGAETRECYMSSATCAAVAFGNPGRTLVINPGSTSNS